MRVDDPICSHGTRWPHECKACADLPSDAEVAAFMAAQARPKSDLVSMWQPERDPKVLRRAGKTAEEAAELLKVCSRIVIQGLHGIDPTSGKTNITALAEEIADVIAQCGVCIEALGLDRSAISARVARKEALMAEWEALVESAGPQDGA